MLYPSPRPINGLDFSTSPFSDLILAPIHFWLISSTIQFASFLRFPSCCICFTQRTFYSHFELLRNAVDNATVVPFLEKRNSLSLTTSRTNPKDALRGGRSSQGAESVSERRGTCKNRFCRSRRRPSVQRRQKRQRMRRKPRRRMSTPLKTAPQQATQILLSWHVLQIKIPL